MTGADISDALVGLLTRTAQAHHAETGGERAGWARWYAERSAGDVNRELGVELTVRELEVWLIDADRRYRKMDPPRSWPKMYATWLIEEFG